MTVRMVDKNKILNTLQSLYRYSQVRESTVDLIVSTEERILKEHLSKLSAEEIYALVVNWEDYYIEKEIEKEKFDLVCDTEFNNKIQNLH
jgi:hypothetical protein